MRLGTVIAGWRGYAAAALAGAVVAWVAQGWRYGEQLAVRRADRAEEIADAQHQAREILQRRQIGGPARGFWHFEEGTRASRGGVWGVYLHVASKDHLAALCKARSVACDLDAIYAALESDDVLAAGVARLLLWTDPKALPTIGDTDAAWSLYQRTWRPGKPKPDSWPDLYRQAAAEVQP